MKSLVLLLRDLCWIAIFAVVTWVALEAGLPLAVTLTIAVGLLLASTAVWPLEMADPAGREFRRATRLGDSGRLEDAAEAFAALAIRLDQAGGRRASLLRAKSQFNRAIMLRGLGRTEDELAALDDFLARADELSDHRLASLVAMAMVNRAIGLSKLGRIAEAENQYREVIRRFTGSDDKLAAECAAGARAKLGS